MMMSEFYERTKVEPSYEEYHFIEESYYEFDGNKDEFCKQWLKDKKSGKWELELRLRKTIEQQKAEYEAKIAEQEESLRFYHKEFQKGYEAQKKLKELEDKMTAIAEIIG